LDIAKNSLYPFGIEYRIGGVIKYNRRQKAAEIIKIIRKETTVMENTQTNQALERYKVISPILTAMAEGADKGKIGMLKGEALQQSGVSRKTLAQWLERYAREGFDGLKYKSSTVGAKRKIPCELVREAIQLRLEVPTRSIPQIIEILEMEGKVAVGFLKRSTLQDRLREEGYSTAQMKLYQQPGIAARRFARSERNLIWYNNSGHGKDNLLKYKVDVLPTPKGGGFHWLLWGNPPPPCLKAGASAAVVTW